MKHNNLLKILLGIVAATVLVGGIILAMIGGQAVRRPSRETIRKTWKKGGAVVVNRWMEGKNCWVEVEEESMGLGFRGKVCVAWDAFLQLSTGDKVVVYHNPSSQGDIVLDHYGNLDAVPAWCFFLFSGMCFLAGCGLMWASTQRHIFHSRKPILRNSVYIFLSVVCGAVGCGAMLWLIAGCLATSPSEVMENGVACEACVARKVLNKAVNHPRQPRMPKQSQTAKFCFLELSLKGTSGNAEPIRVAVREKTLARANKGDVVKVWFYKNHYWVDAYGEMDQEPPSLPLSLASVCGGFFLMGYFIRKARQAKRRERVMGGT